MKRSWLRPMFVVFLVSMALILAGMHPADAAKPAKSSCKGCHADFTGVLPQGHTPVKGNDLAACTSCHKPDPSGTAKKNRFSARMHLAHLAPKGKVDCLTCHRWTPGKSFGLTGQKASWGTPNKEDMGIMKDIFASWAGAEYTDSLHAKAGIACSGCHGKELPKADATVENSRCLTCHGPMEKLVLKTEPKDFKDRNAHKSHLGDIACTVCHKAHAASKVYCLDCHKKFEMKIQGVGKAK